MSGDTLGMGHQTITDRLVAGLIPYARNARTHSDAQVAQIAASISEFGFNNPILTHGDGVVAGHGRLLAARKLGMATVPCLDLAHLTKTQARAYVLADNQLAMNAGWDAEMLALELVELKAEGVDLALLGFDDVAGLMNPEPEGLLPGTDEDAVPDPPKVPITKPGDIITLGRHRLMCGDSTSLDNFIKLMGSESPAVCITDPPYGLGDKKESGKNDYHAYVDSRENLEKLARGWLPIARENCRAVVFSPGVTNAWIYPEANWIMCWFYGGGQLRSSWGFNCWQPFLCYGKDPSLATGNGGRPDGVNMNTPANSGDLDHPCPKPVALWDWLIDRLSFVENEILYEPFGGSGTTFIACEKKNRRCYGMELDPIYCDVIVTRWEQATGQKAVRP